MKLAPLVALAALAAAVAAQTPFEKLTPADAAEIDRFGTAISVDGDRALVGAPRHGSIVGSSGAAYVYEPDAAGTWVQAAKLAPSDSPSGGQFGISVALSGDVALVGAIGAGDSGAAYVFERTPGGWVERARLTGSDLVAGGAFGGSVAIEGDTAVVGATFAGGSTGPGGAAFVFRRTPAGAEPWTEVQKLVAADGAALDAFGSSVALDGDRLVVGAHFGSDSGAAYVFEFGAGAWSQRTKLVGADSASGDFFGFPVALDGDLALIGASRDGATAGAAYVFRRATASSTWTEVAKLTAGDGVFGDFFGTAVALEGDVALVGASRDADLGLQSGSVYLFERASADGSSWVETAKVRAIDGAALDEFGIALGLSEGRALIGAAHADGPAPNTGAVYAHSFEALQAAPRELSLTFAGTQSFELRAGPARAGLTHLLLGSLSGTSPGLPVDGVHLPLEVDSYTLATLLSPNTPPLGSSLGTLDAVGRASATFALPTGLSASLVGTTLHHAFVVVELLPGLLAVPFASNAAPLTLTP